MIFSREKEVQTLLQQALKFTRDELQANRLDTLSDAQIKALREERLWNIIGYTIIVTLFVIIILHPVNFIILMLIMLFVSPLIAIPSFWIYFKIEKAIVQGKTEKVTGIIRRSIDFQYRHRRRSRAKYQILIGQTHFNVPKHVHDAFIESEVYTLYYIPNMKRIVSGEMTNPFENIHQRKLKHQEEI